MKKYSEWQKYVREQSEKMRTQIDSSGKTPAERNPAPSAPQPELRAPRVVMQSPVTKRDVLIKRNVPVSVQERPPAPAPGAGAAPSPFVSVKDVWKAAEKTARAKPAPSQPERRSAVAAPAGRPRAGAPPRMPAPPPRTVGAADESREEILERLINPTLSLEEVAKVVGVCKATIRRYTAKGALPHYRTPGNQRRFKLNDVLRFLEEQRR